MGREAAIQCGPGHSGPGHSGPGHSGPGHIPPQLLAAFSGAVNDVVVALVIKGCSRGQEYAVDRAALGYTLPGRL